jgi:hypothetical protein
MIFGEGEREQLGVREVFRVGGLTEVVESIEASHRFMPVAEEGAGEGMSDWHSLGC